MTPLCFPHSAPENVTLRRLKLVAPAAHASLGAIPMFGWRATVQRIHQEFAFVVVCGFSPFPCAALLSCEASVGEVTCSPDSTQTSQPIINGTSNEVYLGLGQEDIAAIVSIAEGTWPTGLLCTGVLVRSNWLLTGAHCLVMVDPVVEIHTDANTTIRAKVTQTVAHPSLDVALVSIEPGVAVEGADPVRPFAVGLGTAQTDWVGQRVELAGWGLTESGAPNGLRFAVESVVELNDTKIRVHGLGRSGACEGDSGGPMLIRGTDGRPTVAGILSTGSASCLERDSYIRGDLIAEWMPSILPAETEAPIVCGAITKAGRCLYGSESHCVDGALITTHCGDEQVCGWSKALQRYDCMTPVGDPCKGYGSSGLCDHQIAYSCEAGKLSAVDCGPCSICQYDPTSGQPACIEAR